MTKMTGLRIAKQAPPRFKVDLYDRSPVLTAQERQRIAAVVIEQQTLHFRLNDPLTRLLVPLRDCLLLTGAKRSQYSLLRELVTEMQARQEAFWAWREEEWSSLFRRCKNTGTTSNTLQHVMAMAAILCDVDLHKLRNEARSIIRRYALTTKIFGREPVDASIELVHAELKRLGYTGYFHPEVRNALCELFLSNRTPDVRNLTAISLEDLRAKDCALCLKRATFMISHAFASLGIIAKPLPPYVDRPKKRLLDKAQSVGQEWFSWCKRWHDTSTLRPSTKCSTYYRLLVAGRWLSVTHPDISRPDQWTRQVAAEYVAAIGCFRAGQFVDDQRTNYRDKPLSTSSKFAHIAALRCFFTDLLLWELIPYSFDPKRTFQFPRSLTLLRSPNPRIIAEDVWAKLLWAGLNLQHADLPRSEGKSPDAAGPRYPLELIRALAVVWLFAGLRKDEIARLRVGCTRRYTPDRNAEAINMSSVCLLEVPANKTNGGYTKPVHGAVGEAIEEWQNRRPALLPVADEKTGEMVNILFGYRGRPLGRIVLNRSVIPMLCRKAGVPGNDVRGRITSHRARSTIATQLYNAKEPMSLLALKEWLGHRRLESTQWYAAITPDKLTQAYLDARYFERNVAVVQVLLDRAAIENGSAAKGQAYKYVHLGHGYCANPYWAQCQHRMACQRCDFYVPRDSSKAQALEANAHNQRLLEQIPVTETERKALAGDRSALEELVKIASTDASVLHS
jgi:hypothetical protein